MDAILVYSKSILIIMNKVEFSINKTENDVHKTSDTSLRFFEPDALFFYCSILAGI